MTMIDRDSLISSIDKLRYRLTMMEKILTALDSNNFVEAQKISHELQQSVKKSKEKDSEYDTNRP